VLLVWLRREEAQLVEYRTQPVTRGALRVTVTATGNLAPTNEVDVQPARGWRASRRRPVSLDLLICIRPISRRRSQELNAAADHLRERTDSFHDGGLEEKTDGR
jgi:hypothetical protein